MPVLTIQANGKEQKVDVEAGESLVSIAQRTTTPLTFGCQEGDCGVCSVRLLSDRVSLSPKLDREEDFLRAMRAQPDERLACQCAVQSDATILVPDW